MEQRIEVGGHGGQGVVLMSYLLAHLGMRRGLNVTWFPSYGAEMRGGTASCSVRFSHDIIDSPLIDEATHLIALNNPSLVKLMPKLIPKGIVIYNTSLVSTPPHEVCDEPIAYPVPATEMAQELGQVKTANMVILGVYIGLTSLATDEEVEQALRERISAKHEKLIPINLKAVSLGRQYFIENLKHIQ